MRRKTTWQASGGLLLLGIALAFLVVGFVSRRPDTPVPAETAVVGSAGQGPFSLPRETLRFVDDRTRGFGPWEHRLEQRAARHAAASGIEFHVVTQADGGAELAVLSARAFESRSVSPDAAGAVVIVIEHEGRRAGIRVSSSLEALYPALWLRNLALHQLAAHAGTRGIGRAVESAIERMQARALERARLGRWQPPLSVAAAPAYQRALDEVPAVASLPVPRGDGSDAGKRRFASRRRARYAPSTRLAGSVTSVMRVFAELAGDATLEVFTPGSQCLRSRVAVAPLEYWERADSLEASQPFEFRAAGERAVVTSPAPAPGFEPLLFERVEGLWRLDLVTMQRVFRATGDVFDPRSRHPYAFAFAAADGVAVATRAAALDPVDIDGRHPIDVVAELEAELAIESSARRHLKLAELLLRNCGAVADALAHYERAARAAPTDRALVERVAERGLALGLDLWATPYLRALGQSHYEELATAYRNAARIDEAEHFYELALAHAASASARRALKVIRTTRRP